MAINELTTLELPKLNTEQRLKLTQGIVDDLIRALNLGNYSLIWRYISDDYSTTFTPEAFTELHEELTSSHAQLEVLEQVSSVLDDLTLREEWLLTGRDKNKLSLKLKLSPVKEFLVIEQLSIQPV